MSVTFLSALPLLSALASAVAPPASVAAAFGNTIVSTYPDGRTAELWLQQDGGYSAEGRRGDRSSGHWTVKNDKLCLKQARPLPAPFSYCTQIPSGGINATWTAKAVTGEVLQVQLVRGVRAGRPREAAS